MADQFPLHGAAGLDCKVLKWAIRFQSDPTALSINYEKIHAVRDLNLKSVRIDLDWRGIVFKPEQGDVYVLLYVDHHDEAYRWAGNRKLAINPVTGAMQIVVLQEVMEPRASAVQAPLLPVPSAAFPLFGKLTDHQLLSLGTPQDLLSRIKAVTSEHELDGLQAALPVEVE